MWPLIAFIVSALGATLNTVLYVLWGSPWSLGGAIFCGMLAMFNIAQALRYRP